MRFLYIISLPSLPLPFSIIFVQSYISQVDVEAGKVEGYTSSFLTIHINWDFPLFHALLLRSIVLFLSTQSFIKIHR